MKLGLQLFGCMRIFNEDPDGFFARVSGFGYNAIEPCVLFGDGPKGLAWDSGSVAAFAEKARGYGLAIDSAHVFVRDFEAVAPQIAEIAKRTGIGNFVVGYRGDCLKDSADDFARRCARTAEYLAKNGTGLWLHNNREEIAAEIEGVSVYEYILRYCGGALRAQVDTGWVLCGGVDVSEFLARNAQYISSIHHKDVSALPDEKGFTQNSALGEGLVDTKFAFAFAKTRDLSQIVDLDNSAGDFMDDLKRSAAYINKIDMEA